MTEFVATQEVRRIGIAEGAVCRAPVHLRTTGLGSCVGVTLYDPVLTLAGLVHIMLPQAPQGEVAVRTKYADTGITWLHREMLRAGASSARLIAKIAGGAQMFKMLGQGDLMRIGPRNVEATLQVLSELGVRVAGQEVGGSVGRTIEMDPATGLLQVRTAIQGVYVL